VQPIKSLRQAWKPEGRLMATLNAHEAPVYSIGVSDSMLLMVTGDTDGMCCIWDTEKLKDYLAVPLGGKIVVEGAVTALKFLHNTHTIAVGTNKGAISLFKLDNDINKKKYIPAANEGGIVNCCTYRDGSNTIVYATQRGVIHVHDLRVRKDANSFDTGSQKGLVSAFCMGPNRYSYFVGTGGGYVFGYDIRFNLVTTICRHTSQLPIMDMCTYVPEKNLRSGTTEPLLFIATNGDAQQIDLCYINKETPEWSFAIGNSKLLYQSYVPYGLRKEESMYTNVSRRIQKRIAESIVDSGECKAAYKDFEAHVMKMYEDNSIIYKILCPCISQKEESASFLLTTGADRIVRYWYLGNMMGTDEMKTNTQEMTKNSFIVISPDNREVEYDVANFREKVLFEKPLRNIKHNGRAGQSMWQGMNGITHIKDKEIVTANVNHTDAILNMDLIESHNMRFLATCGRDNLVKLWS
jgi:WD40 repeat protein